jgi:hypothetical protein
MMKCAGRADRRAQKVSAVRLDSLEQIRTLAETILDAARTDPVVCVSSRAHDSAPLVDVGALAAAVGELPVYVVPTGELTWELTSLLPDKFDVYGGAARIWWPSLSPGDDPHRHPLVFCWGPYGAPAALARILRELSRWGWDVAAGTDLTEKPERPARSYTLLPAPAPVSAVEDDFPEFVCGQVLDARVVEVFPQRGRSRDSRRCPRIGPPPPGNGHTDAGGRRHDPGAGGSGEPGMAHCGALLARRDEHDRRVQSCHGHAG